MPQNSSYAFSALLSRMKYINRWGLMRSTRTESLSEHSAETAQIAHMLGLIALGCGQAARPETLATAALYHDASEIITGDLPTPVKYKNSSINAAYKQLEAQSAKQLASHLPAGMQATMQGYLTGSVLTQTEKLLLKAADKISALIKCIEEKGSGNTEFLTAEAHQRKMLAEMQCPAANIFIENFLPCFAQTLDELTGQSGNGA